MFLPFSRQKHRHINNNMQLIRTKKIDSALIATVGNFDGLHLGHQKLIEKVVKQSKDLGLKSALISFYPHPAYVLKYRTDCSSITSLRQKYQILQNLGLDYFYQIKFDKSFSKLTAQDFVEKYLLKKLNVKKLIIGPDTNFGQGRQADAQAIASICEQFNIQAEIISLVEFENSKIASRNIRQLIEQADFEQSKKVLGRDFSVLNRVVHGDKRGAQLGFPTANLIPKNWVLPANGVYAGSARIAGKQFKAVANLGVKPSFGTNRLRLEVHLLEYSGPSIYDQFLEFKFVKQLRAEKKFDNLADLKKQISLDLHEARNILDS